MKADPVWGTSQRNMAVWLPTNIDDRDPLPNACCSWHYCRRLRLQHPAYNPAGSISQALGNARFGPGPRKKHKSRTGKSRNAGTGNWTGKPGCRAVGLPAERRLALLLCFSLVGEGPWGVSGAGIFVVKSPTAVDFELLLIL